MKNIFKFLVIAYVFMFGTASYGMLRSLSQRARLAMPSTSISHIPTSLSSQLVSLSNATMQSKIGSHFSSLTKQNLIASQSKGSTNLFAGLRYQALAGLTTMRNFSSMAKSEKADQEVKSAPDSKEIKAQTWVPEIKLEGHTDWVDSAAFSPDGKKIVTASWDKTARVWNAYTGEQIASLQGHTNLICSAAFSRDGKHIFTASCDKSVRVYDEHTAVLHTDFDGHIDFVTSAAFSPDGTKIVPARWDEKIRVWNAYTGKHIANLKVHTNLPCSTAFGFDGDILITAREDKTVEARSLNTGQKIAQLGGHTDLPFSATFSPAGIIAKWDETVRIWNADTSKLVVKLQGHTEWVNSAAFSPDGKKNSDRKQG